MYCNQSHDIKYNPKDGKNIIQRQPIKTTKRLRMQWLLLRNNFFSKLKKNVQPTRRETSLGVKYTTHQGNYFYKKLILTKRKGKTLLMNT